MADQATDQEFYDLGLVAARMMRGLKRVETALEQLQAEREAVERERDALREQLAALDGKAPDDARGLEREDWDRTAEAMKPEEPGA